MKHIKLFEQYIAEKREDVGKYNTVKKVVAKLGRRPSEQELATFITNNYYDVTEVERGEDDPSANDKIADLVAFYKFDIEEWEIAWADAQNESVVTEARNFKKAKQALIDFNNGKIGEDDMVKSVVKSLGFKFDEFSEEEAGLELSSKIKKGKIPTDNYILNNVIDALSE